MTYKPPPTPFCGFVRDKDTNARTVAVSGPMVLVSAPTGTGKTRSVLAPAAVLWTGPAVVVSSKDDLFQLVAQRRFGPQALIDLRPDYDATYPGITAMSFDPTKMITSPNAAAPMGRPSWSVGPLADHGAISPVHPAETPPGPAGRIGAQADRMIPQQDAVSASGPTTG